MPYKATCCREVDPQPRTSETELARLDGGHCSRCRLQEAAHIKQAAAEAACSAAEAGHSPRVQRLQHAPAFLLSINFRNISNFKFQKQNGIKMPKSWKSESGTKYYNTGRRVKLDQFLYQILFVDHPHHGPRSHCSRRWQ